MYEKKDEKKDEKKNPMPVYSTLSQPYVAAY